MEGKDDVVWGELFQRVEQIIDGEAFRCIELLSMKEQSQVARLVRSLLKSQLERARAASINAAAVVENWHRVVGPLDSEFLALARQTSPMQLGASTVPSTTPASSSASTASTKKRRRVELSCVEDEEEFLQLAEAGDCEAAIALLEASKQPTRLLNCSSEGGLTALHRAAFAGDQTFTRRLLELRANHDRKTEYGFTALMAAVQSKHVALLTVILEHGATVNIRADLDGRTALHLGAAAGDFEICQALLARTADPSIKDRKGKSPVDKARDNDHEELVHLLQLRGHDGVAASCVEQQQHQELQRRP